MVNASGSCATAASARLSSFDTLSQVAPSVESTCSQCPLHAAIIACKRSRGVEGVGALTGGELNVGDVSLDAAVFLDLRAELVKLA